MISISTIGRWQNEAAARSARDNRVPITLYSQYTAFDDARRAPFLGDYIPAGWRKADDEWAHAAANSVRSGGCVYGDDEDILLFVDTSGGGAPDEPALTSGQLEQTLKALCLAADRNGASLGVALQEVGQFQAHLRILVQDAAAEEQVPSEADPDDLCPSCEEHFLDDDGGCDCGYNRCEHCWEVEEACSCERCPVCNEKESELCGCYAVTAVDEGSIWRFELSTDEAREWWKSKVQKGLMHGNQYIVEHRFALDIVRGLSDDGISVEVK